MLAIRMQRTGRKGHAMFRVVVQDARRTPTSGKIVAQLGSYDPHTKAVQLAKDKASFYLEHGAQPSERVARLLKSENVKLPEWVSLEGKKSGAIKNPEKLRRNRPAGTEAPVKEPVTEAPAAESTEAAAEPEPAQETIATEESQAPAATEVAAEPETETISEPESGAETSPETEPDTAAEKS